MLTDPLEPALETIASTVRGRRRAKNLSLEALATLSGVSKGSLVKLEQRQGNPSIAVLCQVAAALGVSLADLLHATPRETPIEFDPAGGKIVWRGKHGGTGRLIAGTPGPHMLELWDWEMRPAERHDAPAHSSGTQEIILVTSGQLGVSTGNWSGVVRQGRGLLVTTDVAHAYWCAGKRTVRFRLCVSEFPGRQ